MATVKVNGLNIGYELIGDGSRPWIVTEGGRFNKEYPGVRELAVALAERDGRVLIWDRPNCGESDVCFEGETESQLHADTLAALLEHFDMAPAVLAGGSAGSRVSLFAAARHPEVVQALALWWISGGVMGQMTLGNVYCAPNIRAAWKDDMAAVADLPDWAEAIERNPGNRQRILDQDRDEFIATMERWMMAYCPQPGQEVPGLPDDRIRAHRGAGHRVPQRGERSEPPAGHHRRGGRAPARTRGSSSPRGATGSGTSAGPSASRPAASSWAGRCSRRSCSTGPTRS